MIKRMLSKAFLSIFLEKRARDRVLGEDGQDGSNAGDPLPSRFIEKPPRSDQSEPQEISTYRHNQSTSKRRKLIEEALAIQGQQAKKLDNLPPEDKLKLHLLARMALLGEDITKK